SNKQLSQYPQGVSVTVSADSGRATSCRSRREPAIRGPYHPGSRVRNPPRGASSAYTGTEPGRIDAEFAGHAMLDGPLRALRARSVLLVVIEHHPVWREIEPSARHGLNNRVLV